METISEMIEARATDKTPGLVVGDSSWTWAATVACSRTRAALATSLISDGPPHICLLLDNVPEFCFWLGATALAGHVLVGGNPNHSRDELSRDIAHTECQLLVTDMAHLPLVDGLDLGPNMGVATKENPRILLVDSARYEQQVAAHADAPTPDAKSAGVTPSTLGYLIFTSGTSGAPKAVRCSQGRMAFIGTVLTQMFSLGPDDVCFVAMPMFHSNALMAGWAPALAAGATIALPSGGRFSASGFLPDVRRYEVTYFNYVGKPLSYILATPEKPDDADTSLRQVFGNEAASADVARFAERFGCPAVDGYGSTEGGANVSRTPDAPSGSLGLGVNVIVVDPETGIERARARFDEHGRIENSEEAIGEMVSTTGAAGFEGYWKNEEAESQRIRDGWYWTGDLGYCDEAGYLYFAGRTDDWLRVDGENFAAAPVTRILERHPDVVIAAVYAVPDAVTGDQVMAALQLKKGTEFDPEGFAQFLTGQSDLGKKWVPRYLRICDELPTTATAKILTRSLRAEGLECIGPVWRRSESTILEYEPM